MLWRTVTQTFKGNGPNSANWSKWVCITFWSTFCSLLTTNWKGNASLSLNSFLIVFPIAQQFVISSYTEELKQIFELESIPSVFLYDILKKLSAKLCLDVSGFGFCLDLLHFVSLLTSYAVAYFHTYIYG